MPYEGTSYTSLVTTTVDTPSEDHGHLPGPSKRPLAHFKEFEKDQMDFNP